MSELLKPCPFCGNEHLRLVCTGSQWFVECPDCNANGPMVGDGAPNDNKQAVEKWNIVHRLDTATERLNRIIRHRTDEWRNGQVDSAFNLLVTLISEASSDNTLADHLISVADQLQDRAEVADCTDNRGRFELLDAAAGRIREAAQRCDGVSS